MIDDYAFLKNNDAVELEELVMSYVEKGYEPQGGGSMCKMDGEIYYCQTMIHKAN